MLNRSQRNFAHATTVTLSWHVQKFVVISRIHFKPGHYKFWSNFEFDWSIVSGTGARAPFWFSIKTPLIARFMGPTWGPSGANRPHVSPMNFVIWAISIECSNHARPSAVAVLITQRHVCIQVLLAFDDIFVDHQISNISHTKSQNLNVSHLVLQLSLPNPLKPSVKWRMKM